MSEDVRSYWAYCLGEVDASLGIDVEDTPFRKTNELYQSWLRGFEMGGGVVKGKS